MKLLLTSTGFRTEEMISECERLVGKNRSEISFAIINHAHAVEKGDKRWNIKEQNDVATSFGGRIDIIDLLSISMDEAKQRILKCDAIYAIGGNTDYLMHIYQKTSFTNVLKELLKNKVYVGSSAGSMVLAKRVSADAYRDLYGEDQNYDISNYMELVDFAITPHLDSPIFNLRNEENLSRVLKDYEGELFAIRDDQAVVVDKTKIYFLGGEVKVFNSKTNWK